MKHDQNKQADDTPVTLGAHIRQARERQRITARKLSSDLHMHGSYISRVETGCFKQPSPETLQRIAEYLRLDFSDLCALAGYSLPGLPAFAPYLRIRYDMSDSDARSLTEHFERLRQRHHITEKVKPQLKVDQDDNETEELRSMRESIDWAA
ncbi:helix-turn-helix domain-containing protein [Amycolatopsis sp. NPDC004772]